MGPIWLFLVTLTRFEADRRETCKPDCWRRARSKAQ
jgi:hypothetical protein